MHATTKQEKHRTNSMNNKQSKANALAYKSKWSKSIRCHCFQVRVSVVTCIVSLRFASIDIHFCLTPNIVSSNRGLHTDTVVNHFFSSWGSIDTGEIVFDLNSDFD